MPGCAKPLHALFAGFFLTLLLAACSGGSNLPNNGAGLPSESAALYPHPSGWDDPAQHGAATKQSGLSACTVCHPVDPNSAGRSGPPACRMCHPLYPHASGWKDGSPSHGDWVTQNGKGSCASRCHGSDLNGGLSGVSCGTCHHASGWNSPAQHGQAALGEGKSACKPCHGDDFSGGSSGVSCSQTQCHANFPHSPTWRNKENHGSYVVNNTSASCATARCHGVGLVPTAGVTHGTSCNSSGCHEDYPHSMIPNWVAGAASVHASTFITKIKNGNIAACQGCHGAAYDRAMGDPTHSRCLTCHPFGVTHLAGWALGTGHGSYYSTTRSFNSSSEAFCKDCHGHPSAAVTFLDSHTKPVLSSQSDCYRCHWSYPHKDYQTTQEGNTITESWAPSAPPEKKVGHILYIGRHPLFTDSNGVRPPLSYLSILAFNGASWVPAISHTCGGGTANNCHYNGYRSNPTKATTDACGDLCHAPTNPAAPSAHPFGVPPGCLFCHGF